MRFVGILQKKVCVCALIHVITWPSSKLKQPNPAISLDTMACDPYHLFCKIPTKRGTLNHNREAMLLPGVLVDWLLGMAVFSVVSRITS